ncbi:MAG TPA: FG-GAP-like repeat-containing protein [Terriglobales bacterium]|nr:FG-GAP-like repeat-containing protein [Terriglobales bacterium]
MGSSSPLGPVDLRRRDFLIRFCQGASAALIPAGLRGLGWPSLYSFDSAEGEYSSREFQLHPHYRMPRPLDALLLKTQAGLDDFVTEKYADQISAILAQWSSGLLRSPQDLSAVERVLLPNFAGSSPRPIESRVVRPGPAIEVRHNTFTRKTALGRDAFLQEVRSALGGFSKILTAEFQVTTIEAGSMPANASSPGQLQTRIRYELVATGRDVYREQRVGYWQLAWERSASGEFRVQNWQAMDETQSRSGAPGYVDIAAAAFGGNASYSSQLLHGTDYWRTVLDGACGIDVYGHNGVSVGDIDGDGFDDLYVCQPGGLPNRLYHNRGDGTFEDITEASGVGVIENTACALFVDIDNDGRQDLIVVRATGPMLFLNEGGGRFRQKAGAFQFANPPQGTFTGAAVADYDRDGWLDIYFCLYVYYQGTDQYKYPSPYYDAENGPPNFMMRNNRDGTFRDVTAETGLNQNNTRYSFCCGWNDFNRDGWPDLYVVNDFGRKNLYRNNGNGTFTDIAAQAGVEDVGAGMSVCWFDYDNDGVEDLYVADMWTAAGARISMQDVFKKDAPRETRALYHKHAMGNSLFRNASRNGGGAFAFEDTTRAAGVGIGRWAWSSDSWDFDHDGFPDLYICNGMVSSPTRKNNNEDLNSFFWRQVVADSPEEAKPSHDYEQGWSAINELIRADGSWSGYERNIFYINNGDRTFSDISGVIGLDFLEDGRAFALADFDHDGRQEVFLKNRNGPQLRLLKNVMEKLPPSIAFHLRGTKSNRDAIGAVITLESDVGHQIRSLQAGSGFLSQHSKDLFFGLGGAKGPLSASIRWPSGLVQQLRDLPINHRVWIEEGSEPTRMEPFRTPTEPVRFTAAKTAEPQPQEIESLPNIAETWLLAPVEAPDFSLPDFRGQVLSLSALRGKPVLLNFWAAGADRCKQDWIGFNQRHAAWARAGLQLLAVNLDVPADAERVRALVREHHLSFPILRGSEDVAAIYNIVYRYLFDRHRDLDLPTSFLISAKGEIVKVYQGPVDPEHVEQDYRHIPQNSAERFARALPFPGVSDTIEFGRNYLSYGSVFFQRGYMDQAEASFQIALRDDPTSAEALYGIGSVYLNQQKTAAARESFERALKLRASYPDTLPNSWNNLGLLAAREGRTDEAIGYFQKALQLSPDHTIALDNLGSAYRRQKRWDDARGTYARALEVNPNDAEANYGLGMVFAQNDDTARAFDSLQKALKLRPVYPEALNNLGILYLRTQRRDQAVASFEECIRVAPAFDQAYLNLARVYVVEGTPESARAVLLELLKQHPGHEQAQKMMEQLGR